MGQSARRFSGDMSVFTIESDSFLGLFKNVTIRASNEMQESKAAQDAWRYRVTRSSEWDVDLTACVEVEAAATSLWEKIGDTVAIVLTSDNSGGVTLTGNVVVRELSHSFPDTDGQEQVASMEGQGALTITYTA